MKKIYLKSLFPTDLTYRQQVKEFAKKITESVEETIVIDVSDVCLSRSAMDEYYKQFVSLSSPLSARVSTVGANEDFELKLKAVIKTQHIKKHLRHFSAEQLISVKDAEALRNIASGW